MASVGPSAYSLEQQIGFLLRRAHQRACSIFNSSLPDESLTPPQFAVLAKLSEGETLSQNQLGRLVDIDRATVQGIVQRLQQRGFVDRKEDPDNRSRLLLSLTVEGDDLVRSCLSDAHLISRKTLEPLTDREQTQLLRLLGKMLEE